MPVIGSVDPVAKRIYLAAGVRSYHPIDMYREMRALRRTDEALRGFDAPLVASGNQAKGQGRFTPRLVTFRLGWRVVPEDVSHTLSVTGEQITDNGQSGPACFDMSTLSATSKIIVEYEPPAAEIITVQGGSVLTTEQAQQLAESRAALDVAVSSRAAPGDTVSLTTAQLAMLRELWQLMGLDATEPLVVTATSRTAGAIDQSITDDDGTVTVARSDA
jgi:hypothetical protein